MPTGPGPTRKDDGSHDASVDDIADLLVEEESRPMGVKSDTLLDKTLDDGLDVMLETPGPVLASTFLPPPPAPVGPGGDEGESVEDAGAASNLAYEDLLAKLVLPAKAPEPEATLPLPEPLPVPEAFVAPPTPGISEPVFPSISLPSSSPSLQAAPPSEEQTLVTDNPLVAEEQQAAYREGRITTQPRVQDEMRPALTEPVAPVNVAKSKLLVLGGLLFLAGAVLATIIFKLLGSSPTAQAPTAVVAPPPVPQPTPAPPAQVKPLPPTPPVPAPTEEPTPAPAAAEPAEAKPAPAATAGDEESPSADEKSQARARKREAHRAARPAPAPKAAAPAPAPKAAAPAPAPKAAAPKPAAPAPAAKAAKPAKKGKGSSYADPFDN